ncbi:MAG: HAMP domain-containing sensor histidine kinase [Gammaproteobacteria bacterium]
MNFAAKIYISILSVATLTSSFITLITYNSFKSQTEQQYINQYHATGKIISDTFRLLETEATYVNINALHSLDELLKQGAKLSDKRLDDLANELGVQSFYIIGKNGRFIRSSDLPISKQVNSLFSYDPNYRKLLTGEMKRAITPIIPSFPDSIPLKFIMMPNYNKTLILESGTKLEYISNVLRLAIKSDKNIQSIGLYSLTGYELGSINSGGIFHQGRRDAKHNIKIGNYVDQNSLIVSIKIPFETKYCRECIQKEVSADGSYYYILQIAVSISPLLTQIKYLKAQCLWVFIIITLIGIFLSLLFSKKLVNRLEKINFTVKKIIESGDMSLRVDISNKKDEFSNLAFAFNQMLYHLKEEQKKTIKIEKVRSMAKLASQVAHDIRSPLAALQMAVKDISGLPESERIIIRNATKRINDIANNLITHHHKNHLTEKESNSEMDEKTQPELISVIIDNIISEKRYQYSDKDITFNLDINYDAFGLFAQIESSLFKRILSNLLDNSVEAILNRGIITIKLRKENEDIFIEISDNGCGISAEVLPKIMQEGKSIGKKEGSGLGLSSAIYCINEWNGKLDIQSQENIGTTVQIALPICSPASWFCSKINISDNSTITILDDDDSIHAIWKKRFETYCNILNNVIIVSFKNPNDLSDHLTHEESSQNIYLIDYELSGNKLSGLDYINQLDIASSSLLVTSRYEDNEIRKLCREYNIKIIPKDFAPFIPIEVVYSNPDLILIDDNIELCMSWELVGSSMGKRVVTFNSPYDFMNSKSNFKSDIPIYIDSALGQGIKGEKFAKIIFEKGFTNIYLCTGYNKRKFNKMHWIKDIINKEFPI